MSRAAVAGAALAALALACGGGTGGRVPTSSPPPVVAPLAPPPAPALVRPAPAAATPIADAYREVAARILADARADRGGFDKLRHLTDRIGNRLAGSAALDTAIAWAADAMRADGHDVRVDKVMVPRWVRGAEAARITAPIQRDLVVLGLGGSVGTPKGGVTGKVVVVRSWAELEARKAEVAGAIVLYDVPMPAWTEADGPRYGDIAPYRWAGASEAAARGARAVLMRSVTARSLRTPHTGGMGYRDGVAKIPAAAVTTEDADLLARLAGAGDVTVTLEMGAKTLPDVPSANVIGELRGRERPDEIVVIGAHLDSWDVGQGAHDDGAGCVHVMQALTTLRRLGLVPRRTIRVVLFTNEENGLRGGTAYAADHAAEVASHVAAIESDSGGFAPVGFEVAVGGERAGAVLDAVTDIASLLVPLGATAIEASGHAGADIDPLVKRGVAGLGLRVDSRTYFDIHHTAADTLDKVDPAALADGVAAMAIMAYVLADMPDRLHTPPAAAAP